MLFSGLRASAYRIAAAVFGVLAVTLLVTCLFLWNRATRANVRADAESARAQALQVELHAVNKALERDKLADAATGEARKAGDTWKADNAVRAAKVKAYADSAGDACIADPDILRELAEGRNRISAAEDRLRGL